MSLGNRRVRIKAQVLNEGEERIINVQPTAKSGAPSGMGGMRKNTNPTSSVKMPNTAIPARLVELGGLGLVRASRGAGTVVIFRWRAASFGWKAPFGRGEPGKIVNLWGILCEMSETMLAEAMNPTRRRFLRTALAAAPLGIASGAGDLAGKIRIAVKFQMIREPIGILEKFRLLKELGFDGTELKTSEDADPDEVRAASQETGLPIHGVINASDPDVRGAVDLAKFYGGDSVLVLAREDSKLSYGENFAAWQDLLRPAVPHAEAQGIFLCIENVRATFLKTAEAMAKFIDSFGSPAVRSYFDTGNTITWTEQPAEHWANVLGKRIHSLDIKDRGHPAFGEPKLKREGAVGTNGGEVNWARVREELVKTGFSGWATAEVAGGGRERLAGIAAWMRDVLALS